MREEMWLVRRRGNSRSRGVSYGGEVAHEEERWLMREEMWLVRRRGNSRSRGGSRSGEVAHERDVAHEEERQLKE
jgi:hypothetical protein